MRKNKNDLTVKVAIPGVTLRTQPGFGGNGAELGGEWFSLATGVNTAPLLDGRLDDTCEAEHWGYVESGAVIATYRDGTEEHCKAGDFFHWAAGHNVRVEQDAELLMFSPYAAHDAVLEHIRTKVGG